MLETSSFHPEADALKEAVKQFTHIAKETIPSLKFAIAKEALRRLHELGVGDGAVPPHIEARLKTEEPMAVINQYLQETYGPEHTFDALVENEELRNKIVAGGEWSPVKEREKKKHDSVWTSRAAELGIELSAKERELVALYNGNPENFNATYSPTRVGVANAMERWKNLDIEPDFKTSTDGDWFFIKTKDEVKCYAFPRFALTFQESSYGPGAMGRSYDCVPSYNPRLRYKNVHVLKPAIFEDRGGGKWEFKEKGVLDLGEGKE